MSEIAKFPCAVKLEDGSFQSYGGWDAHDDAAESPLCWWQTYLAIALILFCLIWGRL